MPVILDDLLMAAATKAGQALGQELAKDLFEAIFGTLASKADLRAAVAEIEEYVHQEFDGLKDTILYTNVLSAISLLKDYDQSSDVKSLDFAYQDLTTARSWIEAQRSSDGDDFLRLQFATVVTYITYDISLWLSYALTIDSDKYTTTLVSRIEDHNALLAAAIAQIKAMETESVSAIHSEHVDKRQRSNGGDGGPPQFDIIHNARAWYVLSKGAYPNGEKIVDSGWLLDADEGTAINRITPQYNQDVARIAAESANRSAQIYTPCANFISAMTDLRTRLATPDSFFRNRPSLQSEKGGRAAMRPKLGRKH